MNYNPIYVITSLSDLDIPAMILDIRAENRMALERLESIVQVKSPLAVLYLEEPYDVILLGEDPILDDLKARFVAQGVYFQFI